MKEPLWIKKNVLIAMHKEIIAEHGGINGIRDANLLESSCSAPMQMYYYYNPKPSITDLASHYAYSITRNHPFMDGNKRMSAIACELFLNINEHTLIAEDTDLYFMIIDLASSTIAESIFSAWLKENTVFA